MEQWGPRVSYQPRWPWGAPCVSFNYRSALSPAWPPRCCLPPRLPAPPGPLVLPSSRALPVLLNMAGGLFSSCEATIAPAWAAPFLPARSYSPSVPHTLPLCPLSGRGTCQACSPSRFPDSGSGTPFWSAWSRNRGANVGSESSGGVTSSHGGACKAFPCSPALSCRPGRAARKWVVFLFLLTMRGCPWVMSKSSSTRG